MDGRIAGQLAAHRWESYTGDPKRGDVWQYCADQLSSLAAVGVPADQERNEQ